MTEQKGRGVKRWLKVGVVLAGGRSGRAFPPGDSRASVHRQRSDIAVDRVSVGWYLSRMGQAQNPPAQAGEICPAPAWSARQTLCRTCIRRKSSRRKTIVPDAGRLSSGSIAAGGACHRFPAPSLAISTWTPVLPTTPIPQAARVSIKMPL